MATIVCFKQDEKVRKGDESGVSLNLWKFLLTVGFGVGDSVGYGCE
jgi:hypothetical protein